MKETLAQSFVRYVHEDLAQVKQPHFDIAFRLDEAKRLGYAEQLGYKNIYDLAETEFGFKRRSTAAYIAVCQEYMEKMHVAERWQKYSFSQLVEMLPLQYYDRTCIMSDWTIKQIRQWRKDHKQIVLPNGDVKFWGELTDKQRENYLEEQNKPLQEIVSESVQTSAQQEEQQTPSDLVVDKKRLCLRRIEPHADVVELTKLLSERIEYWGSRGFHGNSCLSQVALELYAIYGLHFTRWKTPDEM